MNLQFKVIDETSDYYIESAPVTINKQFWINWQTAQKLIKDAKEMNADPPKNLITDYVSLRREIKDNIPCYYAIRKRPKKPLIPFPKMPSTYYMKNKKHLLSYQPKSVSALCDSIIRNKAAIDSSDTGLGKTYVSLAVARELSLQPAIICKKAGIASWKKAAEYMNITPLFIVNWEFAKNGKFQFCKRRQDEYSGEYIYTWQLPENTIILFDEVHLANNFRSQNCGIYKAAKGIPNIAISATIADEPAKCKPFFHVLDICDPDTFFEFLIKLGHFENLHNKLESLSAVDDMKVINRYLFPYYGARLTYKDSDIKDYFPESVNQTHIINIGAQKEKKQNKLYHDLLESVLKYRELGQTAQAMVADLRYRQAVELLKADSLAEITQTYILEGKSVCIFVNFRETLFYLSKRLHTNSLIYGNQENDKLSRERVIDAFQGNKTNLILLMADAGGASISLHDLHGDHQRISLICPPYRALTLKQIMGRTYRANTKSVPVIKLVYAANTIEEKVCGRVNEKLDNIHALNDGDLMESDIFSFRKEEINNV